MKLKSLEQIKDETKHLTEDEKNNIIKKYLELNSIAPVSNNLWRSKLEDRRLLNPDYSVINVDMDWVKSLPEDIKLRNLDFCMTLPMDRLDLAKCLYMLQYLNIYDDLVNNSFVPIEEYLNEDKWSYYDLYFRFVSIKSNLKVHVEMFDDKDVGDLSCMDLISKYTKFISSGKHKKYEKEAMKSRKEYYKVSNEIKKKGLKIFQETIEEHRKAYVK